MDSHIVANSTLTHTLCKPGCLGTSPLLGLSRALPVLKPQMLGSFPGTAHSIACMNLYEVFGEQLWKVPSAFL